MQSPLWLGLQVDLLPFAGRHVLHTLFVLSAFFAYILRHTAMGAITSTDYRGSPIVPESEAVRGEGGGLCTGRCQLSAEWSDSTPAGQGGDRQSPPTASPESPLPLVAARPATGYRETWESEGGELIHREGNTGVHRVRAI